MFLIYENTIFLFELISVFEWVEPINAMKFKAVALTDWVEQSGGVQLG